MLRLCLVLETLAFAQVWLAGCLAESCLAPALQYFVMNGLASVTVIIGLFSAYAATGSLVLCGWNAVSSLMIASGVLLKLYVAPVHAGIGLESNSQIPVMPSHQSTTEACMPAQSTVHDGGKEPRENST